MHTYKHLHVPIYTHKWYGRAGLSRPTTGGASDFIISLKLTLLPCHLVLSAIGALATILTSLLQCFLSVVTSLSSASFISVTSRISSIHLLLGRPLLLLLSPHASIIPFYNPSDRITCPKTHSFLLIAVCCSFSSSSLPISMRTLSLVFFSVHDILCIFLHIYISHALIIFPSSSSLSTLLSHSLSELLGQSVSSLSFFMAFLLWCLS